MTRSWQQAHAHTPKAGGSGCYVCGVCVQTNRVCVFVKSGISLIVFILNIYKIADSFQVSVVLIKNPFHIGKKKKKRVTVDFRQASF